MSVIDNMVQHFSNKDIREVVIEEWGDGENPLIIFVTPFTLAEQKKLYSMAKDDNMEMLAYTLILKAKDQNGEPMFTMGDKATLMNNVDPFVLSRVVSEITDSNSVEDHLGN